MKTRKRLRKLYGTNEYGFIDFPVKMSGTMITRYLLEDEGYCTYCFPHSYETPNNKWMKDMKCWKRYRKTQYKGDT